MYYVYFSATLAEKYGFPGNLFVDFISNSVGMLDYNYNRCLYKILLYFFFVFFFCCRSIVFFRVGHCIEWSCPILHHVPYLSIINLIYR